jgi:NitT/TauT family transport system substrate-binding protein
VSVIANGTVDALAAWQPYINQIQNQVGGIVTWPLNSDQPAFGILICNNGWLNQNAGVAERFLKALDEAQDYILNNPEQAKMIVQNQLNYTSSYIDSVWPLHDFSLSLDQSLVIAMQDEAQWMINNQFTNQTQIPNFTNYIYTRGLIAVDPQSVTLVT